MVRPAISFQFRTSWPTFMDPLIPGGERLHHNSSPSNYFLVWIDKIVVSPTHRHAAHELHFVQETIVIDIVVVEHLPGWNVDEIKSPGGRYKCRNCTHDFDGGHSHHTFVQKTL